MENNSRREFITKSGTAIAGVSVGLNAFSSKQTTRIFGANDKIRVGFVGIGNRGSQLLERFMTNKDVEVAALCDVYEPYRSRNRKTVDKRYLETGKIPQMGENFPNKVKQFEDYRKLYEEKDIDAICIATPDHWYALQCIQACDAGFDGADLPVRSGGQVEPTKVEQNLDRHKFTFEELEKINREFWVTGNYQNHSGTRIGSPVSIYYEYDLGGAEKGKKDPKMPTDEIYTFLKKDLEFLKSQHKKFDL